MDLTMKLTLATNVFRDAVDPKRALKDRRIAKQLLDWHEEGVCRISATSRLDFDVPHDPMRRLIFSIPALSAPRETAYVRLDYSHLDSGDVLADAHWVETAAALRDLVFKRHDPVGKNERNRLADVDHLMAHQRSGNNAFVTRDDDILESAEKLMVEFRIKVMSPEDAVKCVKRMLRK